MRLCPTGLCWPMLWRGVAQNEIEAGKIREYKEQIGQLNEQEQKLRELNGQIKELSFARGPRDKARITALREEATKTANRISTYDKILLRLEASAPLQAVLKPISRRLQWLR